MAALGQGGSQKLVPIFAVCSHQVPFLQSLLRVVAWKLAVEIFLG